MIPGSKKIAIAAMADREYVAIIAHIDLVTELADIPKESELANMRSNWKDLSTVTVNRGKTLILKHNSEIMVPKLDTFGTRDDGQPAARPGVLEQDELRHQ